jgi:succinate dehydrogenase assembly factor 2
MNRLIRLSLNLNKTALTKLTATRNISVSQRLNLSKDGKNDETENDMSPAEIDRIKKYEEGYFKNVKQSFDLLQKSRINETVEEKRSRLMYQSRKRGISENGLLLSHFSAQFLPGMNEKELNEYDAIINNVHNEWDLYYWLTSAVELPEEIKNNQVLERMKKYCANDLLEKRIVQPNLAPISNKA